MENGQTAVEVKKIRSYKDLLIWKSGMDLVREVYRVSQKFPEEELFGMCSEMRRAAISVPTNIAVGFNRSNKDEFKHFLFVALGLCSELETQLEIGCGLNYVSSKDHEGCCAILQKINGMTRNLIKRLDQK